MSPNPPSCINNSKFSISRLSPPLPTVRPPAKKSLNSYLKRKYIDYLDLDRKSDASISFTRPIRDYFQETVDIQQKNVEIQQKTVDVETKSEMPEVHLTPQQGYKEQKYLKPKYSSVVMPFTRDAEKMVSREIKRQRSKERKSEGKKGDGGKMAHRSLQTDNFAFDFDEWEFDYEA
jgi:hypothetical protein